MIFLILHIDGKKEVIQRSLHDEVKRLLVRKKKSQNDLCVDLCHLCGFVLFHKYKISTERCGSRKF